MAFEQDFIDITVTDPIPKSFELFQCGTRLPHPLVKSCETTFVVVDGYAVAMVDTWYHKLVASAGVDARLVIDQKFDATFPCVVRRGAKMLLYCTARPDIRHVRVEFHGGELHPGLVGGGST